MRGAVEVPTSFSSIEKLAKKYKKWQMAHTERHSQRVTYQQEHQGKDLVKNHQLIRLLIKILQKISKLRSFHCFTFTPKNARKKMVLLRQQN